MAFERGCPQNSKRASVLNATAGCLDSAGGLIDQQESGAFGLCEHNRSTFTGIKVRHVLVTDNCDTHVNPAWKT